MFSHTMFPPFAPCQCYALDIRNILAACNCLYLTSSTSAKKMQLRSCKQATNLEKNVATICNECIQLIQTMQQVPLRNFTEQQKLHCLRNNTRLRTPSEGFSRPAITTLIKHPTGCKQASLKQMLGLSMGDSSSMSSPSAMAATLSSM